MKRARDSWTEIIGSRSGMWLAAMPMEAGRGFGDPYPPSSEVVLELLGVAHRECARWAVNRIRKGLVAFPDQLPEVVVEEITKEEPGVDFHLPPRPGTCPFCDSPYEVMSNEHIFPKWLLRELVARGGRLRRGGGKLTASIVGPTTSVCQDCNNTWLATLENDVSRILRKMFDFAYELPLDDQSRLALWAAKFAVLLDAASPTPILPRGFGHDLRIRRQPHPGMRVWLAAFAGPGGALTTIPWSIMSEEAGTDESIVAHCLTFTAFKVAFQVFMPLSEGTLAALEDFQGSVVPLWPPQQRDIAWPPPYRFDEISIRALGCRIYDNREPVVMDVSLERAIRVRPKSTDPASN